jgi:hypothetical protein
MGEVQMKSQEKPEPKTAMSCEFARSFHQHFPVFLLDGRADDPILEQLARNCRSARLFSAYPV